MTTVVRNSSVHTNRPAVEQQNGAKVSITYRKRPFHVHLEKVAT